MRHYKTLAETVSRHCKQELDGSFDMKQYSNEHHQLYKKITRSRLTVYQKDSLLQLLGESIKAIEKQTATQ